MVLEGGSIDVNGAGALLTTEQCLLHPNRNPQLGRGEIEALLARYLGARTVIWLGEGIAGDDTDGHVDDIARFVGEDVVLAAVESNPADANYQPLRHNLERLRGARLPGGRGLQVRELPMPEPLYRNGERLPASYANFYIGNRVVLVPVFECPADRAALEILAACFPDRRAVPIDSRALVVGLGAFHCLTQQVPAP
jgi:agmatine deiminase